MSLFRVHFRLLWWMPNLQGRICLAKGNNWAKDSVGAIKDSVLRKEVFMDESHRASRQRRL